MKKIAIVGASAVLAALPVVGVFAATEGSFTDSITVTVAGGCTLEVSGGTAGNYENADRTFSATITNGTSEVLSGVESGASVTPATAMEVTCNTATASSWAITGTASNSGKLASGGNYIESGVADSGDTSSWSYKVSASDATWLAVPTAANAAITSGTASNGNPATFSPVYRVYVSLGQPAGSYTGSVQYTLAMSA